MRAGSVVLGAMFKPQELVSQTLTEVQISSAGHHGVWRDEERNVSKTLFVWFEFSIVSECFM